LGITLIVIPYWWNKSPESVAKMIHLARPDIPFPKELLAGDPIPNEIPLPQGKSIYYPKSKDSMHFLYDLQRWYAIERFEGPQVYWDGNKLFENETALKVPSWFANKLPKLAVEGVLWSGYHNSLSIGTKEYWNNVQLMVHDAPLLLANTYEDRIKLLESHISIDNPVVKLIKPALLQSSHNLFDAIHKVTETSDGFLLRRKFSKYMDHRSLLQVENTYHVNAVVLSNSPFLLCKDVEGKTYYVNRKYDIGKGSVVALQVGRELVSEGHNKAVVEGIRPSLSWSSMCKETFSYYVDKGIRSVSCVSCKRRLSADILRIRTTCMRSIKGSGSVSIYPINLCLRETCLKLNKKLGQVKPFMNKIRVPKTVTGELPKIDEVEWIYENKIL